MTRGGGQVAPLSPLCASCRTRPPPKAYTLSAALVPLAANDMLPPETVLTDARERALQAMGDAVNTVPRLPPLDIKTGKDDDDDAEPPRIGVSMRLKAPKDGEYRQWEIELAARYPLALSEMRWPSAPLGTFEALPLARWGIDCMAGWRQILISLLDQLEAAIAAQRADQRDAFRIVQIKEKWGRMTVYLAGEGTQEMYDAIRDAGEASVKTCEVCAAPGVLTERNAWWSARCPAHENWTPWD